MTVDIISKKTRRDFQEHLVSYVLREIETLFDNHDIVRKKLSDDQLPSGQRRALVEEYYASVDWTSAKDIRKMLRVYEDILHTMEEQFDSVHLTNEQKLSFRGTHGRFLKSLQRDGIQYNEGSLQGGNLPVSNVELNHEATDLLDKLQFDEYVNRIRTSIDNDPALAIGSTKELVEAVLKTILSKLNVESSSNDDVPELLKKVQRAMKLTPDDIDNAAKGAQIIKVLLSNLGQVVHKLAELRNLYGTGHGAEKKRKGMESRHAKLAVGAGITLATFLLDTFKSRSNR